MPAGIVIATGCSDNTPTFTWEPATDNDSGVDFYLVAMDGELAGRLQAAAYAVAVPVPDGTHVLSVTPVDKAGNQGSETSCPFLVDTTAPVIAGVTVPGVSVSMHTAVVAWETNENATSQVEYGINEGFGAVTVPNADSVASHSVTLTGLNSGTQYHFRVLSVDGCGNHAVSGRYVFSTLGPALSPVPCNNVWISGETVLDITASSATPRWGTSSPGWCCWVEFGTTTDYGSLTVQECATGQTHAAYLTGLTPGTLYHYRIWIVCAPGKYGASSDHTFTTLAA